MKFFVKENLKIKIVLMILVIGFLLFPHLIRLNKPLADEKSYYYLRIAEELKKDFKFPKYDELSYGGRNYSSEIGWPVFLALFSKISNLPLEFISKALPFVLGLISFLLFFNIIRFLKPEERNLTAILLMISPAFLYLFSFSTPYTAIIFFFLLGIFLFFKKTKFSNIFSILCFAIIPLFSVVGTFVTVILLFFLMLKLRAIEEKSEQFKITKWFLIVLTTIIIVSLIYLLTLLSNGIPMLPSELKNELKQGYQTMIFGFGEKFGIAPFVFFLALLGLTVLWQRKYKYLFEYLIFFILLFMSYYIKPTLFFLNFFIVILASFGFIKLIRRNWQVSLIKKFTIFIFILGLLFSFLSFYSEFSNSQPSQDIVDALKQLKKMEDGVVFSHYSNGIWINTIANKKNIMDSVFSYAPNLNERYKNSVTLFNSRDIEITRILLDKYNVTYIFIDKKMKEKLWKDDEEGLLFILKYGREFRKIYSKNEIEIWKYVG